MSRATAPGARTPVVAIVGRPNVGKSSLFNRLVGQRRAIVDDEPGVTRDRLVALVSHGERTFVCIDTGGVEALPARDDELLDAVRRQALDAVGGADCVVYVVDAKAGRSPADEDLARLLLRSGRPLILAVNKIDVEAHAGRVHDFHRLGITPLVATSAAHGRGLDDLLDAIVECLPVHPADGPPPVGTRLALIGRPNVGKSSLLNRLLGEERVVVAPTAGTTRDAIDTPIMLDGRPYVLIDTAGIRRRGRIRSRVEGHGAVRALGMLSRSDLVAVVLDAREGITDQDARIIGRAIDQGRGLVLAINKWDLLARGATVASWRRRAEAQHKPLAALPAVGVSARTGSGLTRFIRTIRTVEDAYGRRVATADLNRVLQAAVEAHAPPSPGGRPIRLFYATQTGTRPPAFAVFASAPGRVPAAYVRYLENRLRDAFSLAGVPVGIHMRSRRETPRPVTISRRGDGAPPARRSGPPTPRARRSRRR